MIKWIDLEKEELMKFLALFLWDMSEKESSKIIGILLQYNNVTSDHPLKKLKSVIDNLKAKFATIIDLAEKLCIDESLVLWKGRLSFKQYLPLKRHRFGIKLFKLVDCETGIILDFIIYTGVNTDFEKFDLGVSGDVVAHMMRLYFNKGHILYIDNWYSSPKLAEFLHDKDTGLCGTIKKNRKRDYHAWIRNLKREKFNLHIT
ncbi:piggyBac transposable element-derived protein 4-like [Pseudomyrmex gracilis]|uniref:piggyBac transposable element-derived protein 4-like n=1 Tax=Pseudomyrmex gracilis TaxID=219809 RepID=UPI00099536DD|nr:piggyBac transposable element-derived protein 4-like [Pseudomyrmex gracilis]